MSEDSNDNKQTSLVQIGRKNICPVVDCQTVNFEWVKKVKKTKNKKKSSDWVNYIYIKKRNFDKIYICPKATTKYSSASN